MKNNLLVIFILITHILHTQTPAAIQNGLVREQSSGKKPVTDAQIIFSDAIPTTSDQSGKFRLVFSNKKAGDLIFYQEISKKGYELVNEKELQILKMGTANNLDKDIIMAKAGTLDAAKKEYYDISDKALLASFNKEKNTLQAQLKSLQMTQQVFIDKFTKLSEQYERQQKSLDALADVFARINFDDVSAEYRKSFALFEAGKIDEALKILESTDLLNRTRNRLKEKKRIKKAETAIAHQKAENETAIQEDLQGLQLQAQLYVLTFQIEKAEQLYDQVVRLDSTDLNILQEVADFYGDQHLYKKALHFYPKIIQHPKVQQGQVAIAYGHLADLYTATGNLPNAISAHEQSIRIYENLSSDENNYVTIKNNLAITYSKLGGIHIRLINIDKSLLYNEKAIQIVKKLNKDYPQDVRFKSALAISYSNLGLTYLAANQLDKCLFVFEKSNQLAIEIYENYPQNIDFKNSLAVTYQYLGYTNTLLGKLDLALTFFKRYNQLAEEIHDAYPRNVGFKASLSASYSKLGETYTKLGNLDLALNFFKHYNLSSKELSESYPQNVDFKNALAISYGILGEAHERSNDLPQALIAFERYNQLIEELYVAYPKSADFKDGLATSYEKLGSVYATLGDLNKALTFFEERSRLAKELYENYPQNLGFKESLAISYANIGKTYNSLGKWIKALDFLSKDCELTNELCAADPKNINYKNSLAISCYNLGVINRDNLDNKTNALAYFKKAEMLWGELVREAPQYSQFQQYLGMVKQALER